MVSIQNTINDFEFLGTIAGRQCYLPCKQGETYSRVLDEIFFEEVQTLRKKKISPDNGWTSPELFKKIGEEYSFPWGKRPTAMQGGGFFKTVEVISQEDRKYLSCHQYAIEKLIPQLKEVTGNSKKTILYECGSYGIQYLVNRFFNPVKQPEDGDLVVYYDKSGNATHSGIFRASKQNWNSPAGGTVESKWDRGALENPYVFQHDFFFLPHYSGDRAKVFRPKEAREPSNFPPKHDPSHGAMHLQNKDGTCTYICNEANEKIRQTIDETIGWQSLTHSLPQIECLSDIEFFGVCYMYALEKIFKGQIPKEEFILEFDLLGSNKSIMLDKYFTKVTDPQPGDLAVYSKGNTRVHFGVYIGDDLIESKWGKQNVYRHPPFYVDHNYGDTITYYRRKKSM